MGRDGRHYEVRALYGAPPVSPAEQRRRDDEFAERVRAVARAGGGGAHAMCTGRWRGERRRRTR